MTNEDIMTACVQAELGDAIARQFGRWLEDGCEGDLNESAMRLARGVVDRMAKGPNAISEEAADVRERLDDDGFGPSGTPSP